VTPQIALTFVELFIVLKLHPDIHIPGTMMIAVNASFTSLDLERDTSKHSGRTLFPREPPLLIASVLALITVAAAVLRFHLLTVKSFWFDEGASVGIARLDGYNFIRILWRREANMSLYYVLLRGWLHLGSSEWSIRALSVLFALATIPAIYVLGRRMFAWRAGLIASVLLGVNAFHVRYSQEARSYSLTVLLCVLSSLCFLEWLEWPTRRKRLAFILVSALAVYAHFFSGLLLLAQWLSLYFLDGKPDSKEIKRTWLPLAIAVFPVFAFVATTGAGPLNWIQRPGLRTLWQSALLMTGARGPALVLAYAAACITGLTSIKFDWHRQRVDESEWRYRYLALWLFLPVLLVLALSLARSLFVARYFIISLPALVLLAAAGLARIRRVWLLAPVLGAFLVLGYRGTADFYHQRLTSGTDNWRAAAHYLLESAQPRDGAVFYVTMGRLSYDYYQSLENVPGPEVLYPNHGSRITFLDFVEKPDYPRLQHSITEHSRVWFVISHSSLRSGRDKTENHLAELLGAAGNIIAQHDFGGIEIVLYGMTRSQ
jgi:mannosyltransferase